MESVELRIDALAAGGDGVGRAADGRVVFVPFTAPGDRVRVVLSEVRPRFARGRVEALLEPGRDRCEPACEVFGTCGGCAWQHVAYPAQVEAKAAILRDALERVGGLVLPGPVEVTPCPAPYGYRGRARVLAAGGRVGYRQRRSHALCAVRHCPVLVPELDAELARLAERAPRGTAEWELVADGAGGARATALSWPLPREPRLPLRVAGERMEVSPGVFVQATPVLFDALAEAVQAAAGKGELAIELFAGAGFFSVGLARHFARLLVVESEGRAVEDLHRNLAAAGAGNARVVGGRVERWLERLGDLTPDAAVVDPPRSGLPPGVVDDLLRLAPRRIVYVSCEPSTLARDLAALAAGGYALRGVRGFDLFPQTPHVEAVAALEA